MTDFIEFFIIFLESSSSPLDFFFGFFAIDLNHIELILVYGKETGQIYI